MVKHGFCYKKLSTFVFFLIFILIFPFIVSSSTVITTHSTESPTGNTQQLCRDGGNNLHYVFRNDTNHIFYTKSADNGASWSEPIKMIGGTVYEAFCDANGNNVSVVSRRSIGAVVNVSNDNGATFALGVTASTTMGTNQMWLQYLGAELYYYTGSGTTLKVVNSSDNGVTWNAKTLTVEQASQVGAIGYGTGGLTDKFYFVYKNSSTQPYSFFVKTEDSGATWSSPTPIANDTNDAISDDGAYSIIYSGTNSSNIWISTRQQVTTGPIYIANSSDGGLTWTKYAIDSLGNGNVGNITTPDYDAIGVPALAQGPNGSIYAFFIGNSSSCKEGSCTNNNEILYLNTTLGSSWDGPYQLTTNGNTSNYEWIQAKRIYSGNKIEVVYYNDTGSNQWQATYDSLSFSSGNSAPTITSNTINDTTPVYKDGAKNTLTCSDTDVGDTITYRCYYYRNGVNVTGKATSGTVTSGVATDIITLGVNDYDGSDTLIIGCKCTDGTDTTTETNTSTATSSKAALSGTISSPDVTFPTDITATGSESNDGDADVVYQTCCGSVCTSGKGPNTYDFGAGTYNCVFNTTGATFTNYTSNDNLQTDSVTVSQATRTCTLDTDKLWTRNFDNTASSTTCTVDLGSTDGSMTFTRDAVSKTSPDSVTNVATYAYSCQWTGGTNYSDCSVQTNNLVINKINPSFSASMTTPINYGVSSDYSSSESNNGDTGCTYTLLRNGTSLGTGSSLTDTTVLSGGTHNYTYYTTGCTNYNSGKDEKILTVNRVAASLSLLFNNTLDANKGYKNNAIINITANSSGIIDTYLSGNYTFAFIPSSASQKIENITTLSNSSSQIFNITAYSVSNQNYTGTSKTYYITLDSVAPRIWQYDLNDTYITINQSVMLRANVTDDISLSKIIAEIQTTGGLRNVTMTLTGNNYTYNFTKSDFGESSLNASLINFTKIFTNDTAGNWNSSSINLQLDYGRTELYEVTDSPDPVTNSLGQIISFRAKWNTTEDVSLIGNACSVRISGADYLLSYDSVNSRYTTDLSTSGTVPGIYAYTLTCYNNSYQNASTSGDFEVKIGGSGTSPPAGGGGGGAGDTGFVIGDGICDKEQGELDNSTDCTVGDYEIYPTNPSVVVTQGKMYEIGYSIKNKGSKSINLTVVFTGDFSLFNPKLVQSQEMNGLPVVLPQLVNLAPGETGRAVVKINVPLNANNSQYSFNVNFVDYTTKQEKTTTLRIQVSSQLGSIKEFFVNIYKKLSKPLELKTTCQNVVMSSFFERTDDGICLKGRTNTTIPWAGAIIGVILLVLSYFTLALIPYLKQHIGLRSIITFIIIVIYMIII